MKITIITVCFNSSDFIRDAILSVLDQSFDDIEYIIIDGGSDDSTVEIIKECEPLFQGRMKWVSEVDKGLYDAMNKGIQMATGDVVGILNSDDIFYNQDVIKKVAYSLDNEDVDATMGDVVFIANQNTEKILRRYSSKNWTPLKFAWGYMPPHPSVFIKRSVFARFGNYRINYKIAADYELLIRFFLKAKITIKYIPITTTKMRMGGASTGGIKSLLTLNREIRRACKENQVYTNYWMIYSKYLFKPFEFLFNG